MRGGRDGVIEALEDALQRELDMVARLRELDEIKDAFLLAVSHDLRGPVTAMVAMARALIEEPAMPEERRLRVVASIIANASLIERVQRNLVDLDRLARQAIALDPSRCDLAALVRRCVASADTADRMVSTAVSVREALVDAGVVERILDNLLSNAINHTPAHTPVEVVVAREDGDVLISVTDHGHGVPIAFRDTIFQPFGATARPSHCCGERGVGVGLHLVARFAALHGGRAWVDPTPGGGASFHVLLHEPG